MKKCLDRVTLHHSFDTKLDFWDTLYYPKFPLWWKKQYGTAYFGAIAEYIPHVGLDTSLTSTSLMRLIPSWTCSKSIIMWMAVGWLQ